MMLGGVLVLAGGLAIMGRMEGVGAALVALGMGLGTIASVLAFRISERQRREGRGGYLSRKGEKLFWWVFTLTTAWFGYLAYRFATWETRYGLQRVSEPLWDSFGTIVALWAAFVVLMVLFKRRVSRPVGSPLDLRIFVRGLPAGVAAQWGARTVEGKAPGVAEAVEGTDFTEVYFMDAGPWASDAAFARHAARELDREVLYSTAEDSRERYHSVLPSGEERTVVWADGEPPRLAGPAADLD